MSNRERQFDTSHGQLPDNCDIDVGCVVAMLGIILSNPHSFRRKRDCREAARRFYAKHEDSLIEDEKHRLFAQYPELVRSKAELVQIRIGHFVRKLLAVKK